MPSLSSLINELNNLELFVSKLLKHLIFYRIIVILQMKLNPTLNIINKPPLEIRKFSKWKLEQKIFYIGLPFEQKGSPHFY